MLLYVWHTVLGFFYSSYVLTYGGDAWDYYQHAKFDYVQPNLGTEFIAWITSMPVSLGFTYWPLAFLYNAAGAVGLIFFYAALEDVTTADGKSLFTTLLVLVSLLIPSLSFWTSGIGKDAPAFLAVGIFLWSVKAFSRRQIATASAVLIMLPVRPHVAALMVLSVAAGTLSSKNCAAPSDLVSAQFPPRLLHSPSHWRSSTPVPHVSHRSENSSAIVRDIIWAADRASISAR